MSAITEFGQFVANGFKASPKNIPAASSALVLGGFNQGRVGKANVKMFRNWAEHSEWVRAAIILRKTQVSQAEWDILPIDATMPYSEVLRLRIKARMTKPNPRNDSFRGFIEPIVEDILTLDAGCVEKEFTLRGEPIYMWPLDGGSIKVDARWDGDDPDAARYYWYPDYQMRASYTNHELIYMMMNPATYRVVGLSPLETLKMAIDSELAGSEYNDRQMRQATPDGLLDLGEAARPEQVENFKIYWSQEIAGKGAMAILGGTRGAKFVPFRQSNHDMQFLEWQTYLVRKICAVFQISTQDLNITADINRANGEVAQDNTEDRGIRTMLGLVQDYLTQEYVQDEGYGGADNNLAFRFTVLNLKENETRARIDKLDLAGMPSKTVNEARKDRGRPPLKNKIYDELLAMTPRGVVLLGDDVPTARETLNAQSKSAPESASASEPVGATKEA